VTGPRDGEFLDAVSDSSILLLQPAATVRADADGEELLPHEIGVRVVELSGARRDVQLRSASQHVKAKRLVIRGRPVRVVEGRLYWIFLGSDYLEIRTAPIPRGEAGS
jgi:hypothetical protein